MTFDLIILINTHGITQGSFVPSMNTIDAEITKNERKLNQNFKNKPLHICAKFDPTWNKETSFS